jgi:hypothetical protein
VGWPARSTAPSAISSSAGSQPSRSAAAARARTRTSAQTWRSAEPEVSIDMEPTVRPSSGISPVIGSGRRRRANGTSSSSAAIWASAVITPWPFSVLPKATRTAPSGSKRIQRSRRGLAARAGGIMRLALEFAFARHPPRGQRHGVQDAVVHAAATEAAVQRRGDLGTAGVWIAVQQRLGAHQDAREAVAALAGLQLHERGLQRVRRFGVPSPSTVATARPSTEAASTAQAFTGRPSSSTVQAPHWPRPQP